MARKHDFEEIAVNLDEAEPLSKKQKRLLKKGKLSSSEDAKKLAKKAAKDHDSLADLRDEPEAEDEKKAEKEESKPKRSEFGVWIGNLPFNITSTELRAHLVTLSNGKLEDSDFTRFKHVANKGFVYADVKTEEQMNALIALSEQKFLHRNMLIKNASSFEGRPAKAAAEESKNPPSRILFVGNLTFDTTDDQLRQQFQHCGNITRIRTATFQDSGKCKGFTFIDFESADSATAALKDKTCRRLNGRTLRMEYGEDRSQRRPKSIGRPEQAAEQAAEQRQPAEPSAAAPAPVAVPKARADGPRPERRSERPARSGMRRPTPGMALANANRAKHSVVESTGKKVTFD